MVNLKKVVFFTGSVENQSDPEGPEFPDCPSLHEQE
jgi:hypothetical protein